jgi:hypothetical protein
VAVRVSVLMRCDRSYEVRLTRDVQGGEVLNN